MFYLHRHQLECLVARRCDQTVERLLLIPEDPRSVPIEEKIYYFFLKELVKLAVEIVAIHKFVL